jgi:lipoprotein-anchoring transpeptidase ErfK/SrfK
MAILLLAGAVAFAGGMAAGNAFASDRYATRPAVGVSPDLMAPWLLQLKRAPAYGQAQQFQPRQAQIIVPGQLQKPRRQRQLQAVMAAAPQAVTVPRSAAQAESKGRTVDPMWLPQVVDYQTGEKPGTIVIDTNARFLYLVMEGGKARRYGVGVGKPGFEWAGTHKITRKAEWPDWRPPAEMRAREAKKGRNLPVHMAGGPENPLGARALYLGSTLYRIHGTNQPWTIGGAVSSGCIRMRNEDVVDLYERVKIGTKVRVI